MKQRRLKSKNALAKKNHSRTLDRPVASFKFQKRRERVRRERKPASIQQTSFTSCVSGHFDTAWARAFDRPKKTIPVKNVSKNGVKNAFGDDLKCENRVSGAVTKMSKKGDRDVLASKNFSIQSHHGANFGSVLSLRPQKIDMEPESFLSGITQYQGTQNPKNLYSLKNESQQADPSLAMFNPLALRSGTTVNSNRISTSHSHLTKSSIQTASSLTSSHRAQQYAVNKKLQSKNKTQRDISRPKHTTFLANIGSNADAENYLTMGDLDQKSVRDFRRVANFVAALLFFDMLFLVLGFALEGRHLRTEGTACKLGSLGLTYIIFFINTAYLLVTFKNISEFSSPRDFRRLSLVGSRRQLLIVFQAVFAVCLLQMHVPNTLCKRTSLFFDSYALLTIFLHSIVFYVNFRQCDQAGKTCSFSEAVQSEMAESVAASTHMTEFAKAGNSFCIFEKSQAQKRRKKRRMGRKRRFQKRAPIKVSQEVFNEDLPMESQKIEAHNSLENDNHLENNKISSNLNKSDRKSGNVQISKNISDPQLSDPKEMTLKIENQQNLSGAESNRTPDSYRKLSSHALKTEIESPNPTQNEPNSSKRDHFQKFSPSQIEEIISEIPDRRVKKTRARKNRKNRKRESQSSQGIRVSFNRGHSFTIGEAPANPLKDLEMESDLEDCALELEDLCLSIDETFDMESVATGSVFETPTRRLEDEFRGMCMSAGVNA